MKIKHIFTAQCLLLAAACLQPAAQTKINPAHSPDEASASISVPRPVAQARVQVLRSQLEAWEKQLQVKAEMVEETRQEAVSAGIQGDGAGVYIDTYRQQQKEMAVLKANLTPKIEEARSLIAELTRPEPPAAASAGQSPTPARKPRSASGKKVVKPEQTRVASVDQ